MDSLSLLFGSEEKVKIMRLFLFNPGQAFGLTDIANRAQVRTARVKKETKLLSKTGLIVPKGVLRITESKKGKKIKIRKKKEKGWALAEDFPYYSHLRDLLLRTVLFDSEDVLKRLKRAGRIKLLILSGVFIQETESRVDLLIVGDGLKQGVLERVIRSIEAEIGKELRYASFETPDFRYRWGMYDKLVRDILDFPHKKVVDKIGVASEKR